MPEPRKNADQGRYELTDGGQIVGFAEYQDQGDTVVLPHTEVSAGHWRRGSE